MKRKESIISPKLVEDFYASDKNNIIFWIARTEKYSREKVFHTCVRVGTTEEIAKEIAKEIDKYADSRIKMSDVRPLIFGLLQKKDPRAAKRFRAGETYVRTSAEEFERFNKNKIIESLINETEISEQLATQISTEVENFIRSSNLDYVSADLIREITNVKLLEYGLEDARKLYKRLGMPVYDVTNLIGKGTKENANLQYNPETIHKVMADYMTKEYTLSKLIPRDLSDAHMKGQIHIHDLDYFPTRPFCFSHDIRFFLKNGFRPDGTGDHTSVAGPAKNPEVAFLHAAKILAAAQTNCAGGQGFSYFNTFMAPVVRGLNHKQMKQMAQLFIYEMSQMYVARGGQTVFSSIDLDMSVPKLFRDIPAIQLGGKIDKSVTYGDYEDEVKALFHAFLDVYMKGDYNGKPFNFPKFEVQLYPNELNGRNSEELLKLSQLAAKFGTPYYIIHQPYMPDFSCYQCCAYLMPLDKSADQDDMTGGTVRGGSLQVITINLPQIAYEANGNDVRFFELLDDRMEKARRILTLRRNLKQSYTIGLVGINEMAAVHTGDEIHSSPNAWKFGLRVMKHMKERVAQFREEHGMNFALARTPAESTAFRFARIDRKRYPGKALVQGDPNTNSVYYTNSFHVRPNANVPLFKRMQIEGSFHPLTDGGAMSHIWLGEENPNPEAVAELTKKLAKRTAIQYMAFTKDLTACDSCGAVLGGVNTECPKCGSKNIQVWSRITGYYQNIKGWNKGKLQELKDRRRYAL